MRGTLPVVTFWLITGFSVAPAIANPTLTHLAAEREGELYQASCRLEGALTPEVEEEIGAGLATSIEYRLHVYRRRTAFFDQLVLKRRVECSVRYDTLTQQYTLTRRLDGELQETRVTDDKAAMRQFLTSLSAVPLLEARALEADGSYYLKAKSNLGLIWRFFLIPWPMDTDWERVPIGPQEGQTLVDQP